MIERGEFEEEGSGLKQTNGPFVYNVTYLRNEIVLKIEYLKSTAPPVQVFNPAQLSYQQHFID